MICDFCKNKIEDEKFATLISPPVELLPKIFEINAKITTKYFICKKCYDDLISMFLLGKI